MKTLSGKSMCMCSMIYICMNVCMLALADVEFASHAVLALLDLDTEGRRALSDIYSSCWST